MVPLAVVMLALSHGYSFGSSDIVPHCGVPRRGGVVIHNLQAGDRSDQIVTWDHSTD
jgi:hypothetical protein